MQKQNTKVLALFDFDGTLTTKDSLFDFLLFSVGKYKFILNLLANVPNFTLLFLRLRKNDEAKQRLLTTFFSGWRVDDLNALGKSYSLTKIGQILRAKGMQQIQMHLESGHRVILVSASLELWLRGWCEQNQIELLATKLETVGGIVTGKFSGENCYGQQKVERLEQYLNLRDYNEIYAYGDSSGDHQMLALAEFKHFKPFR